MLLPTGPARWRPLAATICAWLVVSGCRRATTEVVVFHASSLTAALGELAEIFQRENPSLRVRLEPSDSQVAARKVAELGMQADLVAVADAGVIGKVMIPRYASWNTVFATNEMVLAHKDHSRFTDEITAGNWPEVLQRPGVRLGRVNPDTAPVGYHTLLVWQLAEKSGAYGASGIDLEARLSRLCGPQNMAHDEAGLLSLLEARAIDYAFLFRSTAEDHHLKITTLPPEENLSRLDLAERYSAAKVEVRMKQGDSNTSVVGGPATYGITMPENATHQLAAQRFLALLLGDQGKRILDRRGFHPSTPAFCSPCAKLPAGLAALVSSKP